MGDRQEYLALNWVTEELTETLKQAQYALAAYEEDNSDATRLQFCLTYLHQVRGTLDMVEVTGGALLAQEMAALAEFLVDDPQRANEDRLSLLLQGILQLPTYLERVQQGGTDHPAVLAELINDIRKARDAGPVDEARLFTPDLQDEYETLTRPVDETTMTPQVRERLRRLRQLFQYALLGLLRGDQAEENLKYLHRACTRVADQLPDSGAGLMWHIAGVLVDAYRKGYLAADDDPKPTLMNLERQLGHQVQITDQGRSPSAPPALVQQLLYYIARANPESRDIADLQARISLNDTQRQDQQLATARQTFRGPDRNTVSSVSRALVDELTQVKEELDLFVRSGITDGESLSDLVGPLTQISDTLSLLHMQQGKRVLDEQIQALGELQGQDPVDHQSVMDVAGGLLYVESTLSGIHDSQDDDSQPPSSAGREVSAARTALISEVRNAIEACKEAIVAYIGAQWDREHLQPLPGWLQQIEANLNMIPLPAPAAVVQTLRRYVTAELLGPGSDQTPDWDTMDRLADALMGVDYYLERLPADVQRAAPTSDILDRATKSLENLGYTVGDYSQTPDIPDPRDAVHQTLDDYFEAVGSLDEATIDAAWPSDEEALNSGLMDEYELETDTVSQQESVYDLSSDDLGNDSSDALARGELPDPPTPNNEDSTDTAAEPQEPPQEDDGQLVDIFQHEIRNHLSAVQRFLDDTADATDIRVNDSLQRALHTIKGSAHMAGIGAMADTVTPVEQLVKELQAYRLPMSANFHTALQDTVKLIDGQLADVENNQPAEPAPQAFFDTLKDIQAGIADATADSRGETGGNLMSIFLNEAMNTILNAEDTLRQWQASGIESARLKHLRRDLVTLADAARAIELLPLSALANQLILVYEHLEQHPPAGSDDTVFGTLLAAHEAVIDMMDRLAAGQSVQEQPDLEQQLARLADAPLAGPEALPVDEDDRALPAMRNLSGLPPMEAADDEQKEAVANEPEASPQVDDLQEPEGDWFALAESDTDIQSIFLEEAGELLESINAELDNWHHAPGDKTPVSALQRDLHTLKGGARMAEATPVSDLAHELEFIYEALSTDQLEPSRALLDQMQLAQDTLTQMVEDIEQRHGCYTAPHLIAWLRSLRTGRHDTDPDQTEDGHETDRTALDDVQASQSFFSEAELENLDSDILEVFVDEAVELISELDGAINQWHERPWNELAADEMKRVLHTLKGGARLARLPSLGTLSHELETYVVRAQQNRTPLDREFFSQVLQQYDQLAAAIEQLQTLMGLVPGDPAPPAQTEGELTESDTTPTPQDGHPTDNSTRRQPQETVKVNAGLLENLVNLAGESSISRARLEEQINDFGFTLGELDTTIERLRDRVRQLDLETEAQVLFRQERAEESNYEDFDPLEMDRYSQIQQLSRSLMETASDLVDLRHTLTNKSRDAETVLLQQSRIHSDLQEGLMQTRMVPFSRLVPRLRRIVRQVCHELDKRAEFHVHNAEGEMDRSVLERMVSPLEHMLRNAVDHGLESPEAREAAGKPRDGEIHLNLAREGGDIVLTLTDDGQGIDVDSIRRKAIEKGLMEADADLDDHDVLQFILSAGFSTAQAVTQISGRGVGMDVVHNEVKALGGTMDITTGHGQGTTFTVRLPFTVSVNRALMVGAGEDSYAIPLNTIDGVARLQPDALREHLTEDGPLFDYGHRQYRVQSLNRLIGSDSERSLDELTTPQPVILVKSMDRREPLALHVDRLMGSREVVVKTLGPQFASVPSVSGATILGDGSVVIILDLPALLRADVTTRHLETSEPQPQLPDSKPEPESDIVTGDAGEASTLGRDGRTLQVMVVDDSVTVRKVTTRLLERQGMEVLTAKDGMDAMTQLQDHAPDLILLDIEMPRMDGFEVANRIRHTERLQHIPIIMITSRTGQKHKDRAMDIGVNEYMGKPFQEGVLMDAIKRLITT